MKKLFTLLFGLLLCYNITAQISEKDLENIEFLQMTKNDGGTIYGFTKGDKIVGPNYHIRADGLRVYFNYDLDGITQGFALVDSPTTGLMKLMEMEDGKMHGNAFQMTGKKLDWAQTYKKGIIKKVMELDYTNKISNRERCLGNCIGGFGIYQTSDGEQTIMGYFDSMQPTTPVIHIFKSNSMYMGSMKKWEREGFGKYTYSNDGSYYIGMWHKNKRDGLGIWFNKDGSIYKKGYFKKDELIKNM